MKESIDRFFIQNHDHLLKCASNIVRRRSNGASQVKENASSLYCFFVEWTYAHVEQCFDLIHREKMVNFATKYMAQQWNWKPNGKDQFNKQMEFEYVDLHEGHGGIDHNNAFEDEYVRDLLENGLNDVDIRRLRCVQHLVTELSPLQKKLYDMYFIKELSLRDIKKASKGVSHVWVGEEINKIKKFITERCK